MSFNSFASLAANSIRPLSDFNVSVAPVASAFGLSTSSSNGIPIVQASASVQAVAPREHQRKNKRKIEELENSVSRLVQLVERQAEEFRVFREETQLASQSAFSNSTTKRTGGNQPEIMGPLRDYCDRRIALLQNTPTDRENARVWDLDDSPQGTNNKEIFNELVTFANELPRVNMVPMSNMSDAQLKAYTARNKKSVTSIFESAKRARTRSRAAPSVRMEENLNSRNSGRNKRKLERREATFKRIRETRNFASFTKEECDLFIDPVLMSDEDDSPLSNTIRVKRPIWRSKALNDFYDDLDNARRLSNNGDGSKDRDIIFVDYVLPESRLMVLPETAIAPCYRLHQRL